ncbi:Uncharacterized protein dnm_023480 [Desulfonema magnum]|uniref:Uncharacterized protein n=1 Tax=Desulfonema magnum TaxID=45655 RepID=A0A975BJ05_9BACT|nr:Uncharacterized protein dnm_023480 [Desulfonema magnum]
MDFTIFRDIDKFKKLKSGVRKSRGTIPRLIPGDSAVHTKNNAFSG